MDKDLDQDPNEYERDRKRVFRLYTHVMSRKRFRRFRRLATTIVDTIEEAARLAERVEVYVRKGAADEGIICEHLGYDVLSSYQILRNILERRAFDGDFNYEGYRDLAERIQDYAIIHPLNADLPSGLVWTELPPLNTSTATIVLVTTKVLCAG